MITWWRQRARIKKKKKKKKNPSYRTHLDQSLQKPTHRGKHAYLFEKLSSTLHQLLNDNNGGRVNYIMVSRIQWKPIWLATQLCPNMTGLGSKNGVNDDVFAQAPLKILLWNSDTTRYRNAVAGLLSQKKNVSAQLFKVHRELSLANDILQPHPSCFRIYFYLRHGTGDEKDDKNSLQRFGVLHLLQREILEGSVSYGSFQYFSLKKV